jgi:hypothetical protein
VILDLGDSKTSACVSVREKALCKPGIMAHFLIPATWEAEVEGLEFEANLRKLARPYLKNKIKRKGLGAWFKW